MDEIAKFLIFSRAALTGSLGPEAQERAIRSDSPEDLYHYVSVFISPPALSKELLECLEEQLEELQPRH